LDTFCSMLTLTVHLWRANIPYKEKLA
jgi:hypothetical protein